MGWQRPGSSDLCAPSAPRGALKQFPCINDGISHQIKAHFLGLPTAAATMSQFLSPTATINSQPQLLIASGDSQWVCALLFFSRMRKLICAILICGRFGDSTGLGGLWDGLDDPKYHMDIVPLLLCLSPSTCNGQKDWMRCFLRCGRHSFFALGSSRRIDFSLRDLIALPALPF